MQRQPEPELMEDEAQARAYAEADFEEPNTRFVELFQDFFPEFEADGYILDLGCGPGDIALRFADLYTDCIVHGVDGSRPMLDHAEQAMARRPHLQGCVEFIFGRLPDLDLPQANYQAIISNSLIHHLHDPMVLWECIRDHGAPGAPVLVMDLQRPADPDAARHIVDTYATGEPDVLRRDFLNSLYAAFEPGEVAEQLARVGLDKLQIKQPTDRHLAVIGWLPSR